MVKKQLPFSSSLYRAATKVVIIGSEAVQAPRSRLSTKAITMEVS